MGGWMPGATRMPGRNAGYRAGRVSKQSAVCHYTVGINSTGIGVNGYFQFLVRRNGEIVQFAESDAVCWHAGNWNSRGPGIEIEYYEPKDGPHPANIFTNPQLESCGRVVRWLAESDGYPLDFYDGSRVSSHRGFITHRSLIQSGDSHHDYWSRGQWDRMVSGAAPPEPRKPAFDLQSGDLGMDGIFYSNAFHTFYVNDKGQLMQRAETGEGDPGFHGPLLTDCAKGAEARVKVIDPTPEPRTDSYGFAVAALAADLSHAYVTLWNGKTWVKK